ncbi:MAG: nucleotidyltransferase domain-containing protein [Candidatus Aenigmatarchaeota archaeon]
MKANLPEDYFEVLRKIINRTENNPKWVLSGSTNLALHGMNIDPTDIDILTDKKGIYEFREKFRENIVKDVRQRELERRERKIKFHQLMLEINDIEVEILGDFMVNEKPLHENYEREVIEVDNVKIPYVPLEEEYEGYLKTGRYERALMVKEILSEESN